MISLMIILNSGCPSNWRSYYPETQYRFAPVFAVSGGETFWYSSNNKKSPFTPTPHALMALHRVMAYQRPYLTPADIQCIGK